MGRVFDTDGRQVMCKQGFGGENWEERDHLEDQDVDGIVRK